MKKTDFLRLPLAFLVFVIAVGCATHRDVLDLQEKMEAADQRQRDIQTRVASLDSIVQAQTDLLYGLRAELRTGLESVTRNMEAVGEVVKYGEREQVSLGPLVTTPSNRTGSEEMPSGPTGESVVEEGVVVVEGALTPGTGTSGETIRQPEDREGGQRKELYDTAYLDMVRGNYELAIQGFKQFMESGSKEELKDNAQYWIGECHYSMGKLDDAISSFQVVIEDYPRGNKVPAALFKIGKCHYELNDSEEASRYFQSVIGGYPHSEEAKLAREYLSDLR